MQKVGVSIASRLGITAAIALIVAAVLGGGYWWVKSQSPRDTVKDKATGSKVEMEELSFYGKNDTKVVGKVYRQADVADNDRPAVIYIQDVSYGEGWCRSIAATGAVCYAFDFQGEGERARAKELEAVLKGIKSLENQGAHPRLPRLQPAGNQPESQTLQRHHPRRGRCAGP